MNKSLIGLSSAATDNASAAVKVIHRAAAEKIISEYELGNTGKIDTEDATEMLIEFSKWQAEIEKEHMINLVQDLKDYTRESSIILGHDEREASEFVEMFYNRLKNFKG